MKKILFLLLFVPLFSFGQSIPTSPVSFGSRSDLRAQVGQANTQVLLNGLATIADGNGGNYMWNATSTATDDGFTVLQVTGVTTGRWIRLINSNTLKGNVVLSGTGFATAFNITYATPLPQAAAMIIVQAYSQTAAQPSWITNSTTTGFTINFTAIPILGTNNLNVYYLVIKQ